jgi:hypothetical protein
MKITKMVRLVTALSLVTVAAIGVHNGIKTSESYEKLQIKYDGLKESISEMRVAVNTLTEQLRTQCAKLDTVAEQAAECIANDSGNAMKDPSSEDDGQYYIVREYKGYIGVFDNEGGLIREENIAVSVLPAPDRQDLEIGIRVDSEKELNELLEDLK